MRMVIFLASGVTLEVTKLGLGLIRVIHSIQSPTNLREMHSKTFEI